MNEREKIAALIFGACYVNPKQRGNYGEYYTNPKQSFKAADHFIKEMERQRTVAKDARVDCQHDWIAMSDNRQFCAKCKEYETRPMKDCDHVWSNVDNKGTLLCIKCSAPKVAEKIDARTLWAKFSSGGLPVLVYDKNPYDAEFKKFVEVLE